MLFSQNTEEEKKSAKNKCPKSTGKFTFQSSSNKRNPGILFVSQQGEDQEIESLLCHSALLNAIVSVDVTRKRNALPP